MRSFIRSNNLPLSLIGSSYDGVAVSDVIFSGRTAAEELLGSVWWSCSTVEADIMLGAVSTENVSHRVLFNVTNPGSIYPSAHYSSRCSQHTVWATLKLNLEREHWSLQVLKGTLWPVMLQGAHDYAVWMYQGQNPQHSLCSPAHSKTPEALWLK